MFRLFAEFDDEKQWTASSDQVNVNNEDKSPEVALRRTQSFEADDKLVVLFVLSFRPVTRE